MLATLSTKKFDVNKQAILQSKKLIQVKQVVLNRT